MMGKKYKIKKRRTVSAVAIVLILIIFLIVINTGYSLWSSKLNIYGKVTLDFIPPAIDVIVPTTGDNKYTNNSGFSSYGIQFFDFVSDEYSGNSLTTTIKIHKNLNIAWFSRDISVKFSIKNTSPEGDLYTSGKVTQIEVSNPGTVATNVSATILPATISSGQNADFNFTARINRANIYDTVYYKYAITFDVNGVTKYFFYTIRILPN